MTKTQLDILWIIVASGLVFIMRAGFAMLETGLTRSKNSINVAVKVLTDLGISLAAFWPLGFGFMFGASELGLIGTNHFFPDFTNPWVTIFFLFHAMFCSTAATIVSGAVAERIRYSAYIAITFIFSFALYPIVGHWVWGGALEGTTTGWLGKLGFLDFAGCLVVHSTGGWISLAAILILGARIGRYNKDGTVNRITGSNLQTSVIGAILLWFGWFGFNGGSTLALSDDVPAIIMKTTLSGASGLVVTLIIGWIIRKYADVSLVVNGAIAGLVAVTAAVPYVNAWQSVVIGAIGGLIMLALEWFLDSRGIDDAVTAIPVHLGAGTWGVVAVGLFGDPAIMKTGLSRVDQTLIQLLGVGSVGIFTFVFACIAIAILNRFHPIRVKPEEEMLGLNVVEHKASTEMYDLVRTLEDQARSGDLSIRAPVEPFTEVGQIADRYNNLLDSLETNLIARSEYVNILDNVTDGLFLLDADGKIGEHYSQALETILGETALSGKKITDVFASRTEAQRMQSVQEYLNLMFDPGKNERTLSRLNPLAETELKLTRSEGRFDIKHVQVFFRRIMKDGKVSALMVVLRDITEQKEIAQRYQETRDQQRLESELISRVIQIDPADLSEFLEASNSSLDAINETLEQGSTDYIANLDKIFRSVHLIKGDADTLGIDLIADRANTLENKISEVRNRGNLGAEDFLPLAILFRELREMFTRISDLLARIAAFQSSLNESSPGTILGPLHNLTERLKERHGKEFALNARAFDESLLPDDLRQPIREILIQLIRNSAAHGIEPGDIRKKRGKAHAGELKIAIERSIDGLIVIYSDDGAGLDLEAIRSKAVATGRIARDSAQSMSTRDMLALVFTPGFSTAEPGGMTAGRGVGLDAIRELVKKMGGRISIRNKPGVLCEFKILIPTEKARAA